MNRHLQVAVLGAAAVLLPSALRGQIDPSMNNNTNPNSSQGNPNSPRNQNLPTNDPSNPSATPSNGASQPNSMRDTLGAPGLTGQQMADSKFMRAAAEGGLAEVKLGMLATQKGGPEVKEFGQKMVDDHTTINNEMKGVADSLGVMLPKKMNKEDQAEYDKLNGMSGDAFDKEYLAYMVADHRKDFRDFRMEATTAADPTLQSTVVSAMGVIRQHLMMVTKLAQEKGVPVPPRPQRPGGPPPAGQ